MYAIKGSRYCGCMRLGSENIGAFSGYPDPYLERAEKLSAQKKKESDKIKRSNEDLLWLLEGARGRRIMREMLEDLGVWRISFNTDALIMAFNEGSRNAGMKILAQISEVSPESYIKMVKEGQRD